MSLGNGFSMRSPGVRRLMKEASELSEPTELYAARPLDDNLFEWHFTVRGPVDSDFDGGVYHGAMAFPTDYPMRPPNIVILTPNGRFQLNTKICLSISGYHPETWQPSWSIRTALLALIGFMPTDGNGAVGSLSYPPSERKKLAIKSRDWACPACGVCMRTALKPLSSEGNVLQAEAKMLANKLSFRDASEIKAEVEALQQQQQQQVEAQPAAEKEKSASNQNGQHEITAEQQAEIIAAVEESAPGSPSVPAATAAGESAPLAPTTPTPVLTRRAANRPARHAASPNDSSSTSGAPLYVYPMFIFFFTIIIVLCTRRAVAYM